MPVTSIQHRLVTQKYQNHLYEIENKESGRYRKNKEIVQIAEKRLEPQHCLEEILLPQRYQKSISSPTLCKTTLVVLMLLSLTSCETIYDSNSGNLIQADNNRTSSIKSFSSNNSISSLDTVIPQSLIKSFTNDVSIYDSLTFPSVGATSTSVPFQNYTHSFTSTMNNWSDPIIQKINHRLFSYLVKKGVIKKESKEECKKEKLLSIVFLYCSTNQNENSKKIAKKILQTSRPYKSGKHEVLSNRQIDVVIGNWIFKNVLECTPAEYIAKIIAADGKRLQYTIKDVASLLSVEELQKEEKVTFTGLSEEIKSHFTEMWQKYLLLDMPLLHFYATDKSVGTILLKDREFPNLYTGASYLSAIKGLTCCNAKESSEIGGKMWQQAADEGIRLTMIPYFFTPSLWFEAQTEPRNTNKRKDSDVSRKTIIQKLLTHKRLDNVLQVMNDKLNLYKKAVREWLDRDKSAEDELFNSLTKEVTSRFAELDEYLILAALNSISGDEIPFLFSSYTVFRPVTLHVHRKNLPAVIIPPFVGSPCLYTRNLLRIPCSTINTLSIGLETTDLFSAAKGSEERIYALKNQNQNYTLFRVDRDISKYIEADILNYKKIRHGYSIDKNKLKIGSKIFYFEFFTHKNNEGKEGITNFVAHLRNEHSNNLYNFLYQNDNNHSILGKIWSTLIHFIPFYDCIDGIVNKNPELSIPACVLDTVVFAPELEGAQTIIKKFISNFVREPYKFNIFLPKSSGFFIHSKELFSNKILFPTTDQINELGRNTLHAMHRGFRLLGGISKEYRDTLIQYLQADKKTISLGQKLNQIKVKEAFFDSSLYKMVRLPDSEILAPVKKIDQREGRDIYAIYDIETGESGLAYFLLKENNELVLLEKVPEIAVSKELSKSITPQMYAKNVEFHRLSLPDYRGLRWDREHKNAYVRFKDNFLRIKILNDQPFLFAKNHRIPLVIKNHKLRLESLSHRLKRLRIQGLSGRNQKAVQIIANKLHMSEEQASELLNKYEFPSSSKYYSDQTFALWIKETGRIPNWAEFFQILEPESYVSRFLNIRIQENGLHSFSGGTGFVYRADTLPPDIILKRGFIASQDYTAIEKMIPESDPGLIVSGDLTGVLRYNTLVKSPYIYKIELKNVRGVSLKDNLMKNQNGLRPFLGAGIEKKYMTLEDLAVDSNGAIYLDEIHLYNQDIEVQVISIVSEEEIQQELPLPEGPWKNYFR